MKGFGGKKIQQKTKIFSKLSSAFCVLLPFPALWICFPYTSVKFLIFTLAGKNVLSTVFCDKRLTRSVDVVLSSRSLHFAGGEGASENS